MTASPAGQFNTLTKQVETFHQLGNEPYVPEVPGTKGPLHFQHAEPAPISHRIIKSFESKQLPRVIDMLSTGGNESVDHCLHSAHKGLRQHGGYYVQVNQKPDNLMIIFHRHCMRVLIDKVVASEWQAVGVEVNDPRTNKTRKIKASKEVIVSAGTCNTPVVLMHSGIGPKEHLSHFHIPVKQDLPGVGSNLTDHLMVWTFYEINDPTLTNDNGYYPAENFQKSVDQWLATKDGPLAKSLMGNIAFRSFAKELEDMPEYHAVKAARPDLCDPTETPIGGPHIEWFSTEAYGGYEEQLGFPGEGRAAISLTTLLMYQCSRGTVWLNSYHLQAPPLIDHTYLSEPLDVELFAAGCDMAEDIIRTGSGTKDCVTGAWPPTAPHPTTREGWREWVRQRATTCYHPGGTAKMGPASDPMSVVDHRLRFHGIRRLRVAD
ncbi:Choline dehydrogenase [Fusarium sp. LHS14.1]|nr:Choline dehydrogenase [Fusarium sp. LHS14.1]